jgi:hypothetical protein
MMSKEFFVLRGKKRVDDVLHNPILNNRAAQISDPQAAIKRGLEKGIDEEVLISMYQPSNDFSES